MNSIKSRIIVLYVSIMAFFLVGASIFFIFYLKGIVLKPVDSSLLKKAEILDRLINSTTTKFEIFNIYGKKFEIDLSKAQLWIYSSVYSKYYFQLRTLSGKLIEKSKSLGNLTLPYSKKMKKFETVKVGGRYLRLVNYVDKKNQLIIQVAYNVAGEINILERFELIIFSTLFFILFISALAGFFVSKRALEPIDRISEQIKTITEHNLDRKIDVGEAPKELKDLIESFNTLLERLRRAFLREKRFISDVSHELKTPISVIQMQCEIALRKERDREEYKKAIETIKNTVSLMSNLIEKMLMISRLERVDRSVFSEVELSSVLRSALELLKGRADEYGVALDFKAPDEPVFVRGDKTLLVEMFVNLIDNAIKYNETGGSVVIEVEKAEDSLVVNISDTGMGIAENEIDRIFEEFYRIDKSRSKDREGFGLGLSIVKKIAQIHGALVNVKSSVNTGTTFSVVFKS